MDNFIDWSSTTSKSQHDVSHSPDQENASQHSSSNWHATTTNGMPPPLQNPYNYEPEAKVHSQGRQSQEFNTQGYRAPYTNDSTMSASMSPPITNLQPHYSYPQMLNHQHNNTQQPYSTAPEVSTRSQPNMSTAPGQYPNYPQIAQSQGQAYPHPYSYANATAPYNAYNTNTGSQPNYTTQYSGQQMYNGSSGNNLGHYPTHGVTNQHQQPIGAISPQIQYPYQYQHQGNSTYMQPTHFQQYQRPEDALNRVQQTWTAPKTGPGPMTSSGQPSSSYVQWQTQPGQTVYYGMDSRPVAPVKSVPKPVTPSSPPRPNDPLAALRYDVSHCLTDYNTSRDLKGCAAALLAVMTTCDPVLPQTDIRPDSKDNDAPEKLPNITKDELDPKIKQTALLSVVCSEIKGAMIEEVSQNKSIRAKLRTWFVRAHKDSSFVVLKALIAVLDKLTPLTAQSLAEVKFGKALLIVSRKCEDKAVRELLAPWAPKAEESLTIERELDIAASKPPPIQEESKKKKAKTVATKTPVQISDISSRKSEEKSKDNVQKKLEPVAKTNAAFFKKDNVPAAKAVIAKPGMAAALAGIKARKKTESDGGTLDLKIQEPTKIVNKPIASVTAKLTTGKPVFSALKLVEGLKRSASPMVAQENEPDSKRVKKKKRVSWRPDPELEQIQIFETVEPEVGSWEAPQTPHEFGNARDLDRKEGAMLHGGILPDRDEDFIDWEVPTDIDFSYRNLSSSSDTRGPKKAGSMSIHSKFSETEFKREASVLLAEYSSENDIPWSPSETIAMNEQRSYQPRQPKLIPLPAELRDDWRVLQVLGDLTSPQVKGGLEAPVPLEEQSTTISNAAEPNTLQTPTPDITAILASIMAAQQQSAVPANVAPSQPPIEMVAPQTSTPNQEAGSPALPVVDHKLAEFLAQMSATNGGFVPPPLPPRKHHPIGSTARSINLVVPLPPITNAVPPSGAESDSVRMNTGSGHLLPPQFGGLRDVRPWVRFNDNGKYREPCRFVAIGKCEKGNQCGYLHLDVPNPRN